VVKKCILPKFDLLATYISKIPNICPLFTTEIYQESLYFLFALLLPMKLFVARHLLSCRWWPWIVVEHCKRIWKLV